MGESMSRGSSSWPYEGSCMRYALLLLALWITPAWAQTMSPAPNSTVNTNQPGLSVTFLTPIRSARVLIDGQDFSNQVRLVANQVLLTPQQPLSNGFHQVNVEAINLLGITQRAAWGFNVAGAPTNVTPRQPNSYTPFPGAAVQGARPLLSADFPEQIVSARMSIDGQDLANLVQLSGTRVNAQLQTDLSNGQHIANIDASGASGQPYNGQWMFTVTAAPTPLPPPPPPPGGNVPGTNNLSNLNPPPSADLSVGRPYVSADFPQAVNNARMVVDGMDVTNQTQRSGNRISWTPTYDLQNGQHTVMVDGVAGSGQVLAGSWSFNVQGAGGGNNPQRPPSRRNNLQVSSPQPNALVDRRLDVRGEGPRSARVRIQARELVSGQTLTYQATVNRNGQFSTRLDLTWAPSRSRVELTFTAVDPNNGQAWGNPVTILVQRR